MKWNEIQFNYLPEVDESVCILSVGMSSVNANVNRMSKKTYLKTLSNLIIDGILQQQQTASIMIDGHVPSLPHEHFIVSQALIII